MRAAVIVFPGSNCDRDAKTVLERLTGRECFMIWHGEDYLPRGIDLIVIPGGFSYGDYLRSGAVAARSPVMHHVIRYVERGGRVLGICNGFQVLTESGLLPGTLMRNRDLKFICRDAYLRVENTKTDFTSAYKKNQVITVPVAHHDGNYHADESTLNHLEKEGLIAFRYCDAAGNITDAANINGSSRNIAGIFNEERNVLGMMPHPERCTEQSLGGEDGWKLFAAVLKASSSNAA